MPPLMLAGLRFMLVAFPALLFVARPAIPLRLLGYGLTISFGQFAFLFCAIGLGMPAGLASLVLQAQPLPSFLAPSSLKRLQGKQLAGSRWRSSACWCWWREPRRGACPTGGLYADPAAASAGLRQYFQQKNHVPGDPPANHIAGGGALIPVLPFMFASWLIDGPQLMLASLRQIDMLTVLSLLYLALIATLVGYGIWGCCWGRRGWGAAVAAGAGSGDGQRCAAAGGDAERTAARRGGADHGRAYINVFGLRLVRPGMARG